MLDDYTTFDNWDSNGWKTGTGAELGHVVEQEGKFFWAGRVDMGSPEQFEPALKKVFHIEPSKKNFTVTYQYRIRKAPDQGQHFLIAVTIPDHLGFRLSTSVEHDTPINEWLDSRSYSSNFFASSKELWIGLWRSPGSINPPQWEIEFDNIRVKEQP